MIGASFVRRAPVYEFDDPENPAKKASQFQGFYIISNNSLNNKLLKFITANIRVRSRGERRQGSEMLLVVTSPSVMLLRIP